MELFDIFLYTAAIVTVLLLRAEPTSATEPAQPEVASEATAEPALADLTTETEVPASEPVLIEPASEPELEPQAASDSEPQVEPESELEPQAASDSEPDPFEVAAHLERVPAMAATITAPVAEVKVPVTQSPTVVSLRKRCSAAGIRWRNVRGKGKHMSKAQMLKALTAIA